ncbi:sugar-transfer associated ATP-grasp domain-containing protein [Halopelagius longus]|nr:sugar-transfer associated ATP-grasp domain-containing protein [Halopelagius longus]SDQ10534.1 Sugar-transfer associated ATP-grasp [Halopelagius longus]
MLERIRRARDRVRREGVGSFAYEAVRSSLPFRDRFRLDLLVFEWTKGRKVPLEPRSRLRMLRHGFLSSSYYLYGFDERRNYDDYVSEYEKMAYTAHINGRTRTYLDDKFQFYSAMRSRGFGDRLPELFGAIDGGRADVEDVGADRVLELLDGGERLVLKSATGAGGSGVYICRAADDGEGYVVNGDAASASEVRSVVSSVERYLVTEYNEQADYAAAVYPDSPNTVRVMTMHPGDDDAFVAAVVHRFGTAASGGVDNWSRGGIACEVDEATGELRRATRYPFDGELRWFEAHPDTDATIEGRSVPGWERVREGVLELAEAFPDMPYVGWDLLVTEPGEFVVLEGNNQSDVDLVQANRPLLTDDRVCDFYEEFVAADEWPPGGS